MVAIVGTSCSRTPQDTAATASSIAAPSTDIAPSTPAGNRVNTQPTAEPSIGEPSVTFGTAGTPSTQVAPCRGTDPTVSLNIPYRQVAGVEPDLLSLDVYTPNLPEDCGPAPIIVFVHGGGFRIGDKANRIDDKVRLFTGIGWVFASVNYRLSTPGPVKPVRYPTHEQDVAAAIAWVEDHGSEYGGDPTRIMLVGHSSGAFIVSLLSVHPTLLTTAGVDVAHVRCTASLDTEYNITDQIAQGGTQESLYRNAFGDDPAVWIEGSPITHTQFGNPRPNFLILTRGSRRRTDQAHRFTTALIDGGTPASVVDATPLQHDEINTAVGDPNDTTVTPALIAFLSACA